MVLDTLQAEHRHIAQVMVLLGEQLRRIERGEVVNTHVSYELCDYLVRWPDRFHHPREDRLYSYVADLDPSLAADVQRLEREHETMARHSRELLSTVVDWRAGRSSGRDLIERGRDYISFCHRHMREEEASVFPRIRETLSPQDWRELALEDDLKPVPDPVFGRRVGREFRNFARKLRRSVRRGVEHGVLTEWVSLQAALEGLDAVAIGWQNGRAATADHLAALFRESLYLALKDPVRAPLMCSVNNTRLTVDWLGELAMVSRDVTVDLARVNRERRDRLRLLRR